MFIWSKCYQCINTFAFGNVILILIHLILNFVIISYSGICFAGQRSVMRSKALRPEVYKDTYIHLPKRGNMLQLDEFHVDKLQFELDDGQAP